MPFTMNAERAAKITLPSASGSIGELIAELTAIRDRPAIGVDSVVRSISGGGTSFTIVLVKPD